MDERAGVNVPEFTPFARPSGHPGRMCQQWLGARRHVVLRDVAPVARGPPGGWARQLPEPARVRDGTGSAGSAGRAVGMDVGSGTWEKTWRPSVRPDQWE